MAEVVTRDPESGTFINGIQYPTFNSHISLLCYQGVCHKLCQVFRGGLDLANVDLTTLLRFDK